MPLNNAKQHTSNCILAFYSWFSCKFIYLFIWAEHYHLWLKMVPGTERNDNAISLHPESYLSLTIMVLYWLFENWLAGKSNFKKVRKCHSWCFSLNDQWDWDNWESLLPRGLKTIPYLRGVQDLLLRLASNPGYTTEHCARSGDSGTSPILCLAVAGTMSRCFFFFLLLISVPVKSGQLF